MKYQRIDTRLPQYTVKLQGFQGPIELLLYLVEHNQLNIFKVPIAAVIGQYIDYLLTLPEIELPPAYEFLVIAARLLEIKSKRLLPQEEPEPAEAEEEPFIDEAQLQAELAKRLKEYERYKPVIELLRNLEEERKKVYARSFITSEEVSLSDFESVSLSDLIVALQSVLSRTTRIIQMPRETFTIKMKMDQIYKKVAEAANWVPFEALFQSAVTKLEIIITFLALLELIYLHRVQVVQYKPLGEIRIYKLQQS